MKPIVCSVRGFSLPIENFALPVFSVIGLRFEHGLREFSGRHVNAKVHWSLWQWYVPSTSFCGHCISWISCYGSKGFIVLKILVKLKYITAQIEPIYLVADCARRCNQLTQISCVAVELSGWAILLVEVVCYDVISRMIMRWTTVDWIGMVNTMARRCDWCFVSQWRWSSSTVNKKNRWFIRFKLIKVYSCCTTRIV